MFFSFFFFFLLILIECILQRSWWGVATVVSRFHLEISAQYEATKGGTKKMGSTLKMVLFYQWVLVLVVVGRHASRNVTKGIPKLSIVSRAPVREILFSLPLLRLFSLSLTFINIFQSNVLSLKKKRVELEFRAVPEPRRSFDNKRPPTFNMAD